MAGDDGKRLGQEQAWRWGFALEKTPLPRFSVRKTSGLRAVA
jgi:hypothetical protein